MKHQLSSRFRHHSTGGRLTKRKGHVVSVAPLLAGLFLANTAVAQDAACFTPVGGIEGSELCEIPTIGPVTSFGHFHLSADGSTVFGFDRHPDGDRAYVWTPADGPQGIGVLDGGFYSYALYASVDGSVVAGNSHSAGGGRAFRWTEAGGIQNLGVLDGGAFSSIRSMNADGSVLAGSSDSSEGRRAFRWTEAGGIQNLGVLDGGAYSNVRLVSADGAIIAGLSESSGGVRAVRWTEAGGIQSLGVLSGGAFSDVTVMSTDGSVIAGVSNSSEGGRAFRWTEAGGMQSLGVLDGGTQSYVEGMSADGSVVVGHSNSSEGGRVFRWTEAGGMQNLGVLDGGNYSGSAQTSTDGSVVAGIADSSGGQRAFRWTEAGGMQSLGVLDGGTFSYALLMSADGSVIAGRSGNSEVRRAFRWTEADGMQSLGVLEGGTESYVEGMSADGSILLGLSVNAAELRYFIWRMDTMEDLANLSASIPVVGRDTALAFHAQQQGLSGLMGMRGGAIAGPSTASISTMGTDPSLASHSQYFAARAAITRTAGDDIDYGERTTTVGSVSYGYGVNDKLTLGGALSLQGDNIQNNAFDMDSAFGVSLWGVYDPDGAGGWEISGALAGSKATGTVTRGRLLTDVVEATGDADLTTRAVELSFGYSIEGEVADLTPYLTIGHYLTERSAYSESGAAFNADYEAQQVSRTTLAVGLDGERSMGAGAVIFSAGIEHDLKADVARLTGTSDLPGLATFDIPSDEDRNTTRAFANLGYAWNLSDTTRVSASANLSRASFGSKPSLGMEFGYEMRF